MRVRGHFLEAGVYAAAATHVTLWGICTQVCVRADGVRLC